MSKSVNKSIFYSLAAHGAPAVLALAIIPILVRQYGIERFGLLTLFWVFISYLNFLDLGIARTLTKTLATEDQHISSPALAVLKAGLIFVVALSAVGALTVLGLKGLILEKYLTISPSLFDEASQCVIGIALTVPALLLFSYYKSIVEGMRGFNVANTMQFWVSSANYLAPFVALIVSKRLDIAILVLLVLRWSLVVYGFIKVRHYLKKNWFAVTVDSRAIKTLYSAGIWFSLITVINPLLVFLDRFLVASFVPMDQMAFYTAPFEVVTRFWIIPMAVTRILFPVFSSYGGEWSPKVKRHFLSGLLWIAMALLPLVAILFVWGEEIFRIWLGKEFEGQSVLIMKILLVGIVFNCFNWVSFTFIQSSKHIKWTVLIPILELILFVAMFYPLVNAFGVEGAAIAWSGRLVIDAIIFGLLVVGIVRSR
ncbi:MAG: oligosaccharide flippase family protein [Bdellovibrionales bacterium]|nr:oligosaccharide flippase family protein [Bdellovibrionales bacterium]